MKKILLSVPVILLLFYFTPWILPAKADHFVPLPTEFPYSESALSHMRSPYLITLERLGKWEAPLHNYFETQNIGYSSQLQFYTYLYLAQRDAAFLSYNVHKFFIGSLDPLTKQVVCAFFPDFTAFPADFYSDPYSEELAKQVWPHYCDRLEQERAHPSQKHKVQVKSVEIVEKWMPWVTPLPTVPPPRMNLCEAVALMKKERDALSEEQLKIMYGWAEEKGLKLHWRQIANHYMHEQNIPLGKTLFARSILMMGLYDAQIVSLNAKYTYCVPRPFQFDPTIHPFIQEPQTPSYPSGHGTQAGTAEVILSYFFQEAAAKWHQIAAECAQSRIWAGVHTPQDTCAGMRLGAQVGQAILRTFTSASCAPEPPARRCPYSGQI